MACASVLPACLWPRAARRFAHGSVLAMVATMITSAAYAEAPLAPELEPRLVPSEGPSHNDDAAAALVADPAYDPPGRIGRLNLIAGSVSLRPRGTSAFGEAMHNRPIVQGDSLYTGADGRAEVHLGPHVVRLGPSTLLTVAYFDDAQTQLVVPEGQVLTRVHHLMNGETFELDMPTAALLVQHEGSVRVDVDNDGVDVRLTARQGCEADVIGPFDIWTLHSDETAKLTASDPQAHSLGAAPKADAFDQWGQSRDRREAKVEALSFVSRGTVGYEDLDAYGSWQQTPGYGAVWYPSDVAADWAPYQDGRWRFIAPWGWTWIDAAAWGFAPFHYGRWVHTARGWGWAAGALGEHPCYAPALVGFVGSTAADTHIKATQSWFALGYNEPYYPSFRASYGYLHKINLGHVDTTRKPDAALAYVNQQVPGAITTTASQTFFDGSATGRDRAPVPLLVGTHGTFLGSAPRFEAVAARRDATATAATAAGGATGSAYGASPAAAAKGIQASAQPRDAWLARPVVSAASYRNGRGASEAPRGAADHDKVMRTPVPVGPHNDPLRRRYHALTVVPPPGPAQPAPTGGDNAGVVVYPVAPIFVVQPPYGAPQPGPNHAVAPNRYEPVMRPGPQQSPAPSVGGAHFGARR